MCNPIAIGAVMAVAYTAQKGIEIDAQNRAGKKLGEAANDNLRNQYAMIATKQGQIQDKASQDRLARTLQSMRETAKLRVAAGEGMVTGNSPARAIMSSIMGASLDKSIITTNEENAMTQTYWEGAAARSQAQSSINKAQAMITNPFMATLQLVTAGGEGFATGYMGGQAMGLGGGGTPAPGPSDGGFMGSKGGSYGGFGR